MAHYVASLSSSPAADPSLRAQLEGAAKARASDPAHLAGARLWSGACAVCHEPGQGPPMFGVRPSLALNTAIHADAPDTVVRVILEGFRAPEGLEGLGAMPPFLHHLDDAQIADLAGYLRARFAPGRSPWTDLRGAAERFRQPLLTAAEGAINH